MAGRIGLGAGFLCLIAGLVWFSDDYTRHLLILVAVYGVAGLSVHLITGLGGHVSLGQAGLLATGAYTHVLLARHLGIPTVASMALATVVGTLTGAALGLVLIRLSGLYLALGTLAAGVILVRLPHLAPSLTGGSAGIEVPLDTWLRAEGAGLVIISLGVLGILIFVAARIRQSGLGIALVAMRETPFAARACGISPLMARAAAFGLSGAYAAVAGVLLGMSHGYITPEHFSVHLSISILIIPVVGGIRAAPGSLFGAILFVGWPELMRVAKDLLSFPDSWVGDLHNVGMGVATLLVVLLSPGGIHGILTEWWRGRGCAPRVGGLADCPNKSG